MSSYWLSFSIWVPIVSGLIVLVAGDRNRREARAVALLGAIIGFAVTVPLVTGFQVGTSAMQFVELSPWIPRFHVNYHLGVDGISVLFILLNSFVTVLVVIAGWEVIETKVAQYMAAFLVMSGLLNGTFAALDAMLFYVFFEATLIPMYLVIGVWGGPNRVYAAVKFFLYTLLGSLLMLVAFLYLYNKSGGSFEILDWHKLPIGRGEHFWNDPQLLLFFALFAAFSVKVPMWPVHTWLPDAHVEAPTGGSAVLAAILLKLGAYGFIRFSLPILPDASHDLAGFMITLSLVAVAYISLVALVQTDMKKLIAYSSIAHMGFVTLGFFVIFLATANAPGSNGARLALQGGMMQMLSHGLISGAMFLCVGVLYDRMHSRQIADYGGVVNTMPKFAALMVLFALANAGLPGTSGFVGEFFVIIGSFHASAWLAFFAAITLVLGAAYTLWMVKRVVFGAVANDHVAELPDVSPREFWMLMVLAVAVLIVGIWPAPIVSAMDTTLGALLDHVVQSKL